MKKDKKNSREEPDSRDWMSGDQNQLNTVEWLGAIFFYLVKGGKIRFNNLYDQRFHTRNVWVGYTIQLLMLFGGITLVVWLSST